MVKPTSSDVKMLQDFAETCNRSGKQQLHLLLILHKEIENYIDELPKRKVDGWRGVSGRFSHIPLQSNYSQVYDLISTVIKKEPTLWEQFQHQKEKCFSVLWSRYDDDPMFKECSEAQIRKVIYGCYPLHPVTTFMLPRISEKIAQNERTMFTFLSGNDYNTLPYLLSKSNDDFPLVMPSALYDYFAPQMRKEPYTSEVNRIYKLVTRILASHELSSFEQKIVKTIALIYVLGQFEKIAPTVDTLANLYLSAGVAGADIKQAIRNLVNQQCVVYLKRSNAYLKLKESSGVNVKEEIKKVETKRAGIPFTQILNDINEERYLYPNRYNDEFNMTRYFGVCFITDKELPLIKGPADGADGTLYGVIPTDEEPLEKAVSRMRTGGSSAVKPRTVFAIPEKMVDIESICREYDAVSSLREAAGDDTALFDDYDIIYQDLSDVVRGYISGFLNPEYGQVAYFYDGRRQNLFRKSNLTALLSTICENAFPDTPLINNETLNKNHLTTVAINSRAKLLNGLINNLNVPHLGLSGSGQEVSFMRSALTVPGVLVAHGDQAPEITMHPHCQGGSPNQKMEKVLQIIRNFVEQSQAEKALSFSELYDILTSDKAGIGLRLGVIPVYLAVVLKQYQGHVVLRNQVGEVSFSPETLLQIEKHPDAFTLYLESWNQDKENFIGQMEDLFSEFLPAAVDRGNGYGYLVSAMNRWYLSLPKYVKEIRKMYVGGGKLEPIDRDMVKFVSLLKQVGIGPQELLFHRIPACFHAEQFEPQIFGRVKETKSFYDAIVNRLKETLGEEVKKVLEPGADERVSLTSACEQWLQQVPEAAKEHLYPDGAERLIRALTGVGNDEYRIIDKLAVALTGLRINDWNDDMPLQFMTNLAAFYRSIGDFIQSYHAPGQSGTRKAAGDMPGAGSYEITYTNENGVLVRKTFKKESYSKRAKLLYNDIETSLDEMGHSITIQEKRQVLMDLLQKLC